MHAVHHAPPATVTAPAAAPSQPPHSAQPPTAYAGYQIIRRNGAVVAFEPNKIAVAMMKAFLAVHGTQGAASASVRETVDGLTQAVVRALVRSRPGGGTFHIEDVQDQVELGLMRGGHHEVARAYVLYRERRAQERARQAAQAAAAAPPSCTCSTAASACRSTSAALQALIESACAGLGADVKRRADPGRDDAQPVRRRADRRGLQGLDPGRAHADREGPGLHLRHRAPAAAHDLPGGAGRARSRRRRWASATPTTSRSSSRRASQAELLDEKLLQFDLARLGAALEARARPAVRLPRPADAVRPLLPARDEAAHRAAAGLLHARGDGPVAERDRPRSARHRVLRSAVELRLHVAARRRCSTPARCARSCRPAT